MKPEAFGSISPHAMEETYSSSLSHVQILDALDRSTDAGITLDFARMNLSDVGAAAAEELAHIEQRTLENDNVVERYLPFDHTAQSLYSLVLHRVAFSHNRLAALPTEFALLSRLRYLNLKYNCFAVFPEVVSVPFDS